MAIRSISLFVLSTPDVVKIPFEIPQHHQIEESVAIQIHPSGTRRPAAASHAGFLRHIGKSAISVVVIKLVPTVRRNIHVLIAIIVVIPNGYSHSVSRSLQTRFLRNILKRAVCLLVIKPVPILRPCFLWNRSLKCRIAEWRTVDQEKIQTPVVVVVKQRHSRPHRFWQILFGGARRLVSEIYSRARRNIHELSGSTGWRCQWSGSMLLSGHEHQRNGKQQVEKQNCQSGISVSVAAMSKSGFRPAFHGATIPLPSFTV